MPGDELEVIAEEGDGDGCLAALARTRPDVVLLDLAMPGRDGVSLIGSIRVAAPGAAIVVFSGAGETEARAAALAAGADRYLVKGEPLAQVRRALLEAAGRRA